MFVSISPSFDDHTLHFLLRDSPIPFLTRRDLEEGTGFTPWLQGWVGDFTFSNSQWLVQGGSMTQVSPRESPS